MENIGHTQMKTENMILGCITAGNATYKVTCNTMGSRYIVEYEGRDESLNLGFYNDADFIDSYYPAWRNTGKSHIIKRNNYNTISPTVQRLPS